MRDAVAWYAVDASKRIAADLTRAYAEAIELSREHPLLGATGSFATRALSLSRFPFSIVYQLKNDGLVVMTQRKTLDSIWEFLVDFVWG